MTKFLPVAAALLLTSISVFLPSASLAAGAAHFATEEAPAPPLLSAPERAVYAAAFEQHLLLTYARAGLAATGLPIDTYRQALIGFYNLRQHGAVAGTCQTLTIIEFGRSSTQKRLWVLDVAKGRLLHHTLVAHGKNTGEEYAQLFSNREGSEMSSLGFYRTGATYQGKHGLSLKLHGVDAGYNTNALSRSVVVHGADYVSEDFIQQHGRLGRSQGCPALPPAQTAAIIRTIKDGSVVFAHGPQQVAYHSQWLMLDRALLAFAHSHGMLTRAG